MKSTLHRIFFLSIFIIISYQTGQAQLLKKLKNRAMDKIEKRVEDKVVEELSEEIARRVMKPVDKAFDDMLKASYRSEHGEELSDEQIDSIMQSAGSNYVKFLETLNTSVELPDSYEFDFSMTMETKEENGEKNEIEMWLGEASSILGIKETDNNKGFIIIDMKNDIVVMYSEENGKKKAQAIPSMLKLTGTMMANNQKMDNVKIEGPGKSKKILGYKSYEYKVESEEMKSKYFISKEVPFSWYDSFYKSMTQYAPGLYNENMEKVEGMMLEGEMFDKKSKKKSFMKTKDISEKRFSIDNSEYSMAGISG